MTVLILNMLFALMLLLHGGVVASAGYDLFTRSKRQNKSLWFALISVLPFLGAYIYHITKKRKRRVLF